MIVWAFGRGGAAGMGGTGSNPAEGCAEEFEVLRGGTGMGVNCGSGGGVGKSLNSAVGVGAWPKTVEIAKANKNGKQSFINIGSGLLLSWFGKITGRFDSGKDFDGVVGAKNP